jgi:hypothetical protein
MTDCSFFTALSPIAGRGIFANHYFPLGSILFKVINNDKSVTNLGRFVNHSWDPNVFLHKLPDGWYAIAKIPIYQGKEILGNYNWTPMGIEKAGVPWV